MANDIQPKHRRIYAQGRIKQIRDEIKGLKAAAQKAPEARTEPSFMKRHREWVFAKLRIQELRKELVGLKKEAKPNA